MLHFWSKDERDPIRFSISVVARLGHSTRTGAEPAFLQELEWELFRLTTAEPEGSRYKESTMGRPVVIGLGTLILIILAVAFFF
jgi:hypothetical protein